MASDDVRIRPAGGEQAPDITQLPEPLRIFVSEGRAALERAYAEPSANKEEGAQ